MSSPKERFPHDDFFQGIMEALPIPTFVVDADVRIIHANRAALEFLYKYPGEILLHRGGEVLGCINSSMSPEGCGRSENCRFCVIRGSVGESIHGGHVRRRKHVLKQSGDEGQKLIHLLVTTSPLRSGNGKDKSEQSVEPDNASFALLMIEDISELIQLRGIIPVCAWCKKVRDDSDLWQNVEDYLASRLDVDFTHSICHECAEKVLAEGENKEKDEDIDVKET